MAETYVNVNGKSYISEEWIVDTMAKICVEYTDVNDIEVTNEEANLVSAYQRLLKQLPLRRTMENFKERYVNERFIRRTNGV